MQIQIQIPEKVNKIIRTLAAAGHEAYAVGGYYIVLHQDRTLHEVVQL